MAFNLDKAVVDKTGITGLYDFEFRWSKDDQPSDGTEADAAPSLFTAIEETVGVHLQPQKVSLTIFVVDHVERVPGEN